MQFDTHARAGTRDADRRGDRRGPGVLEALLAGIPAGLELPTDRQRPPRPSFEGGTLRTHLPESTAQEVRAFARSAGATLVATMLSAYDVLLHRYSGQETVVVGMTSAARDKAELHGAVGLFASTVALRADLGGDPTFRDVVGHVGRRVLEAVAHQHVPFERIVAALAPERDASRHPIFQAFFAHVPPAPLAIEGAEPFDASPTKARFDLTLWVEEEADGLDLVWEYSSDLFDRTTIERLDRHYRALLESALADPGRPISQLELTTTAERDELAAQLSGGTESYPVACLHQLFERRAEETPDAVAVVFEGEQLAYGALNERANRLAHVLRAHGVEHESLVALCLERSPDLIVAILAVLKAGGAYVPLDPEYPAERIAFALEDTAAPVLVTQSYLVERLPTSAADVVCLDRAADELEQAPTNDLGAAASPSSAAYVIYTSGSTGRPKGVTVEHGNVARLFSATDHWFGFGPDDTWSLLHSYAFDFSVWEIWGALLYGGRLVIVPQWTTRSPSALRELLVRSG